MQKRSEHEFGSNILDQKSILDQIYLDWEYFETLDLQILLGYLAGQSQGPFLGAIDEEMGMQWEYGDSMVHMDSYGTYWA